MKFNWIQAISVACLNRFGRYKKNKKFFFSDLVRLIVCLVMLLLLIVTFFIIFHEKEKAFTIKGQTEAFTITLSDAPINQWDVSKAILVTDILASNDEDVYLPLDSYYIPAPNTVARIHLLQESGKSRLLITLSDEHGASVGEIETAAGIETLPSYAELKLPLNNVIMLPFEGQVQIGEDIGNGVDKILLSGGVRIIEKQLFTENRYIAGDYEFDTGDRIQLFSDHEESILSKVKGFVRIVNSNSISFTLHGEGRVLKVYRLGSAGYEISSSVWSRLTKDPVVSAITTLIATLFLLMEFVYLLVQSALILGKEKNEKH